MFFVSRRYQSKVTPNLFLKKRRSTPKSKVSISCQLISLSTNEGVPYKGILLPLPSSHDDWPSTNMALYKVLDTVWSPILPHEALNLPKLKIFSTGFMKLSLVNTQPAEKEGNQRHCKFFGNLDEPSLRILASKKYLSSKE